MSMHALHGVTGWRGGSQADEGQGELHDTGQCLRGEQQQSIYDQGRVMKVYVREGGLLAVGAAADSAIIVIITMMLACVSRSAATASQQSVCVSKYDSECVLVVSPALATRSPVTTGLPSGPDSYITSLKGFGGEGEGGGGCVRQSCQTTPLHTLSCVLCAASTLSKQSSLLLQYIYLL